MENGMGNRVRGTCDSYGSICYSTVSVPYSGSILLNSECYLPSVSYLHGFFGSGYESGWIHHLK